MGGIWESPRVSNAPSSVCAECTIPSARRPIDRIAGKGTIEAMTPETRRMLDWTFLGKVSYAEAVRRQLEVREALRDGSGREQLLLLEHPHVYTLGRRGEQKDILASAGWLASTGVEVAECDRGGQVTYHGPGQLVGYPIIDLNPDRRDLRRYVTDLIEVLIRTVAEYGVSAQAGDREHIGLWSGGRKLASVGVHVSRWLTTHGFALNVSTDLSYFDQIVPCGLPDVRMTSIEALTGLRPPLTEVAGHLARHFAQRFERELDSRETSAAAAPARVG